MAASPETGSVRRITQTDIEEATAGRYYINVDPTGSRELRITGANQKWRVNPGIIYAPGYRIAGTPENVRAALRSAGVSEAQINRAIAGAYTAENTLEGGSMADAYTTEVEAYTQFRRGQATTADTGYPLDVLVYFTQNRAAVTYGDKPKAPSVSRGTAAAGTAAGTATTTGPRRPRPSDLAGRYAGLGSGAGLDVSNLNLETGTGASALQAQKLPTALSRKVSASIIPGLYSSNVATYEYAAQRIGPVIGLSQEQINAAVREFEQNLARREQELQSRPRSRGGRSGGARRTGGARTTRAASPRAVPTPALTPVGGFAGPTTGAGAAASIPAPPGAQLGTTTGAGAAREIPSPPAARPTLPRPGRVTLPPPPTGAGTGRDAFEAMQGGSLPVPRAAPTGLPSFASPPRRGNGNGTSF